MMPIRFLHRVFAGVERRLYKRIRKGELRNTFGAKLEDGYLDSFELLKLIKTEVQTEQVVIYDVGGHIGTWAVLAKSIFPSSEVHVFEPLPIHWDILDKNIGKLPSVFVHRCALGSKNEVIQMHVTSSSDSSSLLPLTENMHHEYGQVQTALTDVEVVRLDDYVKTKSIRFPQVIKIDVQGYELEALKGAIDVLEQVKYIILEVSFIELYKGQPLFKDIVTFLEEKGISVYAFGKNTALGKRVIQTDVLFKQTKK
ncbi:MAG: FkbM family methyltransferase [Chitinophagaceae bacterium]|nr:FkbM family methyltransferase [Chitinophagaceae bacterium]